MLVYEGGAVVFSIGSTRAKPKISITGNSGTNISTEEMPTTGNWRRLKNKTGGDSPEFTPPVEQSDKSHYLNIHCMHLRPPLCLCLTNPAHILAFWPQTHIFHSAWHSQACFLSPQSIPLLYYPYSSSCFHMHTRKELRALYPCLSFTRHASRKKGGSSCFLI